MNHKLNPLISRHFPPSKSSFYKSHTHVGLWYQRVGILGLSLAVLSCQSKPTEPEIPKVETQVEAPFTLEGSLQDVQPIPGVISLGGLNLISEAADQLRNGLTSFLATPLELRSLWLDNYIQTDLMFSPEFLDTERPLRVIQISHNGEAHTVRIIGVKDIKPLVDSLGTYLEKTQSPSGIIYVQNRYKGDKNPPRFIELGQGLIASTDQVELLSENHLRYYRAVASKRIDGFLSALFYPSEAAKLNGVLKSGEMIDQLELKGSDRSITRQRGMLRSMAELAKRVADDSELTTFSVRLDQPRVRVDLDWQLREGSSSQLFIQQLKGGEHKLIKYAGAAAFLLSLDLPESLMATIVQEWNKAALRTLTKEQINAAANPESVDSHNDASRNKKKKQKRKSSSLPPPLGTSAEQIDEYIQLVTRASKSLGGELLLGALAVKDPLPTKQKAPPTTPEAAEELDDLDLFKAKENPRVLHWLGLFSHLGAEQLLQDLKAVLDIYRDSEIKRAMKKRGLVIKISDDPPLKSDGIEIKSTHIQTRMPRTPAVIRPLRPQLKELYDGHLWVGENFGAVGFASSWKETIQKLATQKDKADLTNEPTGSMISAALKAGVNRPTLFLYLDPITTLTSLKQGKAGSMLLPLQMMFGAFEPTEGLSLSVGKSERGAHARLNIPHHLLQSIKSAMSGTPMQ